MQNVLWSWGRTINNQHKMLTLDYARIMMHLIIENFSHLECKHHNDDKKARPRVCSYASSNIQVHCWFELNANRSLLTCSLIMHAFGNHAWLLYPEHYHGIALPRTSFWAWAYSSPVYCKLLGQSCACTKQTKRLCPFLKHDFVPLSV